MATVGQKTLNRQRAQAGRQSRPAVTRAIGILEAVASIGRPTALNEIAAMQEVPTATAFRLCQHLVEAGYLVRDNGSRRYMIGIRLMRLGMDIVLASGPSTARHKILADIVESIGETCNLTTLVGSEVLYLDRVETRWPLRLHLEPGSRVPLHCTASGKLLLALMPETSRQPLLSTLDLVQHTPSTIVNRKTLTRELQRIAERGYSTDNEEFLAGLIAIAVPVVDHHGRTFAAIACHAPIARLSLKGAIALVPVLKRGASKLAATFAA